MSNALKVSRGQDYSSTMTVTATTTATSYVFLPDQVLVTGSGIAQVCLFAEEIEVDNLDGTNNVYIRLASLTNTAYVNSAFGGTALPTSSGGLFTVNPATFIAATAASKVLPAGVRNKPMYLKSVGFSILAAVGPSIVSVTAYGSLLPIQ